MNITKPSRVANNVCCSLYHQQNNPFSHAHRNRKLNIGIVGGSMSGLFTARALQTLGHNIHIFERRTDAMSGGGITVTAPLMEYLDKYQVFDSLQVRDKNLIPTITTSTIHNDGHLSQQIHPDTVRRHTSWDCLYHHLLTADVTYSTGKNLTDIQLNHDHASQHLMKILFDDNTSFDCDLIVGADGIGSKVRNFVSDNRQNAMQYAGYVAFRGMLDENDINKNDKIYNWKTEHSWVLYHGQNTQFLNYIVPKYNSSQMLYNWVFYVTYNESELQHAPFLVDRFGNKRKHAIPKGFLSEEGMHHIAKKADELLEDTCNTLVKMTKEPFFQVIYDYDCNAMSEYFKSKDNNMEGGIVLVGDAAFVIRPHITKATSKAAGDAMCLETYLSELDADMSLQQILEEYNAERMIEGIDLLSKSRHLGNKVVLQTTKREFNEEYVRSSRTN